MIFLRFFFWGGGNSRIIPKIKPRTPHSTRIKLFLNHSTFDANESLVNIHYLMPVTRLSHTRSLMITNNVCLGLATIDATLVRQLGLLVLAPVYCSYAREKKRKPGWIASDSYPVS